MDNDALIRSVRDAAERVDSCLQEVEDARRGLHRAALRALMAVDGDCEREQALVAALYWDIQTVPVKTLEAVIGSSAQVRALAGPGPLLGRCHDCDAPVRATSRTHLATGVERCQPCERQRRPRPGSTWQDGWGADLPAPDASPADVPPLWADAGWSAGAGPDEATGPQAGAGS